MSGRPSTSSRTVCNKSPCATAAMARVTSVVGQSKSSISVLTDASISPQAPLDRPKRTRWRVLPSRPTTWPTRSSCLAMRWLAATISLNASATLPMMPAWSLAMRTEKSPTRIAWRAFSSSRNSLGEPPFNRFSRAWAAAALLASRSTRLWSLITSPYRMRGANFPATQAQESSNRMALLDVPGLPRQPNSGRSLAGRPGANRPLFFQRAMKVPNARPTSGSPERRLRPKSSRFLDPLASFFACLIRANGPFLNCPRSAR